MNTSLPRFVQSRVSRSALNVSQVLAGFGCAASIVAGIALVAINAFNGQLWFSLVFLMSSICQAVLCFALMVVFSTTKALIFPDSETGSAEPKVVCVNGHNFRVYRKQAGLLVTCPTCGVDTKVPVLSKLNEQ